MIGLNRLAGNVAIPPPFQRNSGTKWLKACLPGKEASIDRSFGRGFFIWWRASQSSSAKLRLVFDQKVLCLRPFGRWLTDPVFDVYTFQCAGPMPFSK
jgi:hypothetical protein